MDISIGVGGSDTRDTNNPQKCYYRWDNNTNDSNHTNILPNIVGSLLLGTTISGAITSKVKGSLGDAIIIAQKAVGPNTLATSGLLRP